MVATITTRPQLAAAITDLYEQAMPALGDKARTLGRKGFLHNILVEGMIEDCGGLPAYTALLGSVTPADFTDEEGRPSSINPQNLALILAFLQAMAPLLVNKPTPAPAG